MAAPGVLGAGGFYTASRAEARRQVSFGGPEAPALECAVEESCAAYEPAYSGCDQYWSTDGRGFGAPAGSSRLAAPIATEVSVCSADGCSFLLPSELVASSPVLQNFVVDDFEACSAAGTDVSIAASLPFHASTLDLVVQAFSAGGRPLALRWELGDTEGQRAAFGVLACAHYLDLQPLLAEACDELARILLQGRNSAVAVAGYVGLPALPSLVAGGAWNLPPEAEQLLAQEARCLGDRGVALCAAWSTDGMPLAQLPQECMARLLAAADFMVREESGLRELLAATSYVDHFELEAVVEGAPAPPCSPITGSAPTSPSLVARCLSSPMLLPPSFPNSAHGCALGPPALARSRSAGSDASACSLASSGSGAMPLSRAMGLVAARHEKYRGSRLLIGALVSLAVNEKEARNVRVFAVRILKNVAHPGDTETVDALILVLNTGRVAGGALLREAGAPEDATAEGVARRLGLDSCCEVREAACAALERVALPGDVRALEALAGLVGHSNFEVRRAAVASLSRIAPPGDLCAMVALAKALRDDDWRVREAAGAALAQLAAAGDGPAAEAGGSAVAVLSHPATSSVDGSAQSIIAATCRCLTDSNPDVRRSARSAIQACVAQCGALFVATLLLPVLAAEGGPPGAEESHPKVGTPMLAWSEEEAVRVSVLEVMGDALRALVAARTQSAGEVHEVPEVALSRLRDIVVGDFGGIEQTAVLLGAMLAVLGEGLADAASEVRLAATESLVFCGGGSSLPPDVQARIVQLAAGVAIRAPATACEALEVLRSLACHGDATAIAAAQGVLQSGGDYISSRSACETLRDIAAVGDEVSAFVLCETLKEPELQPDALAALDAIAVGSAVEIQALTALAAGHEAPPERRAQALRCLTRFVQVGDSGALALATQLLEDADSGLRSEALLTAARLAHRGDAKVQAAVINTLRTDEDPIVRERAAVACEALLEHGETDVIETIVGHAVRGEFGTRQSGLRTLERIAGSGVQAQVAVSALVPWMDTGHWPQRQGATEAVGRLATRGDAFVVDALLRRLHDSDENCRLTACETLQLVALPGDRDVVAALATRVEYERSWIVRATATETLSALLTRDVAELLNPLLANFDDELKDAAAEALAALEAREAEAAEAAAAAGTGAIVAGPDAPVATVEELEAV